MAVLWKRTSSGPILGLYPKPIDTTLVVKDEFLQAKELLDSDIIDSVKIGFERMQGLAAKGDCRAMTEVGITYFSIIKPEKEYRTENILLRRKHLGMTDNNLDELSKSMHYLSAVTDPTAMYPESYYLLGLSYYEQQQIDAALNAFKKGVELINKGAEVAHGYDAVVLKQSLENNVKQLNRIYGFHQ